MAKKHPYPLEYQQAIDIIERIQKIGFPNSDDITAIENYVVQLQKLSSKFKDPIHKTSVKRIEKAVQRIKNRLTQENDIPTKMYTTLNLLLVVFKENLIASNIK